MDSCKKQGGVWREFGDGCGDSCESKINKLPICTTALVYSCDCDGDLCWNENKCISLKDYQIAATKKQAELAKIAADTKIKEEGDKSFHEKSGLGSIFSGTQKVFDYTKEEKDKGSILPEMPEVPNIAEVKENAKETADKVTETLDPSKIKVPAAFLEMERKTKESLQKEGQTKEDKKAKEVTEKVVEDVKKGVTTDNTKSQATPAFPSALPIPK